MATIAPESTQESSHGTTKQDQQFDARRTRHRVFHRHLHSSFRAAPERQQGTQPSLQRDCGEPALQVATVTGQPAAPHQPAVRWPCPSQSLEQRRRRQRSGNAHAPLVLVALQPRLRSIRRRDGGESPADAAASLPPRQRGSFLLAGARRKHRVSRHVIRHKRPQPSGDATGNFRILALEPRWRRSRQRTAGKRLAIRAAFRSACRQHRAHLHGLRCWLLRLTVHAACRRGRLVTGPRRRRSRQRAAGKRLAGGAARFPPSCRSLLIRVRAGRQHLARPHGLHGERARPPIPSSFRWRRGVRDFRTRQPDRRCGSRIGAAFRERSGHPKQNQPVGLRQDCEFRRGRRVCSRRNPVCRRWHSGQHGKILAAQSRCDIRLEEQPRCPQRGDY